MMLRKLAGIAPVAILSLAACGGDDGPDVAKVRADFANPSGSVKDKAALVSATGNRNSSNAAIELAGAGVPGGPGLTASSRGLGRVAPGRLFGRQIDAARIQFQQIGLSRSAQSSPFDFGDSGCYGDPEVQGAFNSAWMNLIANAGPNSASGSAEYSIDASACGDLTGSVSGSILIQAEGDGAGNGSFLVRITQSFANVCETDGAKTCINGSLVYEVSAQGSAMGSGSFETLAAWELNAEWSEDGKRVDAATKGGIKMGGSGDGMSGQFSIEYLLYAKDSAGNEVSFVLEIIASGDPMGGTVTWRYKGSDGTAECTINSDGSGSCSGDISWDAAEYDAEFDKR